MLRSKLFLILMLLSISLSAQDSAAVVSKAHELIKVLSGPEMAGRGYVKKGDAKAADLLKEVFSAHGAIPITDSYFQQFEFPINTFPYPLRMELDTLELLPGETFLLDPASGSAKGSYALVPVELENIEADVKRILKDPCKECAYWVDLPKTKDKDSLALFHAIRTSLPNVAPIVWVNNEKFTWGASTDTYDFPLIEVKFEGDTIPSVVQMDVRNYYKKVHEARNVIAMIPAKGKSNKFIVFSAHYDHLGMMGPDAMFPGANDNASGTVMLLTLAEYYASNPADVNIVFIAFAAEEAGLIGSRYFVDHPTIPLDKIEFLINLDIFGTGDEGITVVNATEHEKEYELLKEIGERDGRLARVKKRGPTQNSDHYWFTTKDVPAFFIYTMGGIKAYHDIYDRPETLPLTEYYDIYRTLTEFVERLD